MTYGATLEEDSTFCLHSSEQRILLWRSISINHFLPRIISYIQAPAKDQYHLCIRKQFRTQLLLKEIMWHFWWNKVLSIATLQALTNSQIRTARTQNWKFFVQNYPTRRENPENYSSTVTPTAGLEKCFLLSWDLPFDCNKHRLPENPWDTQIHMHFLEWSIFQAVHQMPSGKLCGWNLGSHCALEWTRRANWWGTETPITCRHRPRTKALCRPSLLSPDLQGRPQNTSKDEYRKWKSQL